MAGTHRLTGDSLTVLEVVSKWHNEAHKSSWPMCLEQPCHAAQRVD